MSIIILARLIILIVVAIVIRLESNELLGFDYHAQPAHAPEVERAVKQHFCNMSCRHERGGS